MHSLSCWSAALDLASARETAERALNEHNRVTVKALDGLLQVNNALKYRLERGVCVRERLLKILRAQK